MTSSRRSIDKACFAKFISTSLDYIIEIVRKYLEYLSGFSSRKGLRGMKPGSVNDVRFRRIIIAINEQTKRIGRTGDRLNTLTAITAI